MSLLLPASTHLPKGFEIVVLSALSGAGFLSWRVVSPYLIRGREN
eukprot:COSAG02_NODE_795_length_17133_cov_6.577727_16_plen_45_part_00